MYELNKIAFGSFLAQLRKEKGMTQKELAAGLYVSDKAVSKNWLHVIKAMRVWCVVSMLLTPLCTEGRCSLSAPPAGRRGPLCSSCTSSRCSGPSRSRRRNTNNQRVKGRAEFP